jgi:hypothetical protein
MPHAEKRDGKATGFWCGEVDLRHRGLLDGNDRHAHRLASKPKRAIP